MFDERARSRLHHPPGAIPPLVEAPPGTPDEALARRLIAAFGHASGVEDAGPVWETLLRERQGPLAGWLAEGNAAALAADLAALGRSEAAQGFFGGAGQHRRCAGDTAFATLLAAWTHDKLLSLAEALGVVRIELPENGPWGETSRIPPAELWAGIAAKLGVDLRPPAHVGGYLGIAAGGVVAQMRVIEAIHAAWRLRQIGGGRVCEIGGGGGLTAYYALLLGIEDYVLIDLPTMCAVQGYLLGGSRIGDRVALAGEATAGKALRILPPDGFAQLPPGSIDILFNQDSLPEIAPEAAAGYLRDAARLGIPRFLSINQEAHLPAGAGHQASVPELVALDGAWRSAGRHRHWLRQGYVEEMFVPG